MKSLKLLVLTVPFLALALLPARAADEKPPEKMDESEYYPLKVGSVWHYKLGDSKFKLKAVKEEKFKVGDAELPSVRVEMLGDGDKTLSFEHINVTKEGVRRLGFEGNKAEPPVVFIKLPVKKDETWKVDSKIGKETLKGTFKTGEEKIKVGDKEYDTVFTTSDDLDANGMKVSFTTYFAKKVGMVKQVIKIGTQEVVIELEKFEEGK